MTIRADFTEPGQPPGLAAIQEPDDLLSGEDALLDWIDVLNENFVMEVEAGLAPHD